MSRDEHDDRTSGGVSVTDELVQRLAAEAAAGYDVGALRRRGGRRPLGSGPADVVPVRLDPDLRAALSARAEAEHTSASDVIRQALRSRIETTNPIDAFARAVTCEDVSATGFVDLFQSLRAWLDVA